MSAPRLGDAAFKYTEGGQDYWHHLGHPLHRAVADVTQRVDTFRSADYTTERRIAIGSGVQDLKATIRKDGQPESLRRFLASARRGAALEYFPSLASPSESYPCSLLSDSAVALDGDFWFEYRNSVDVVLRRTDGGSWVGLTEGTLFYYTAGNDLPGLTFTRSGTVGSYVDEDGYVQTAAATADTFRTTWIDGAPYLLLERAGENAYDFSDDLSDASWNKQRTTVSQNAGLMGPNGVTSASSGVFELIETTDTGVHYIEQTLPSLTDSTHQVSSIWARRSSRQIVFIQTINKANRNDTTYFDLANGVVGTSDADHITATIEEGPQSTSFRWYKLSVVWDSGTGGTTPRAVLGMTNADGTTSYTGDGSKVMLWNPMLEVDTGGGPSSDIVTDSATDVSRVGDTFYADFPHAPQEMTVYAKFIERGTVRSTSGKAVFHVGASGSGTDPRFHIQTNGTYYALRHDNGTTDVAVVLAVAPSYGDTVELVGVLNADGSVQLWQSINGAAATSTSAGAAVTLSDAWADQRIYIGSRGTSDRGVSAINSVKVARGVRTLAEMRAL